MPVIKTNQKNLERMFLDLQSLAIKAKEEDFFVEKAIEYAYSVIHNESSRTIFLDLFRRKIINDEVFRLVSFYVLIHAEIEGTKKRVRYHRHDVWKDRDVKHDFKLLQKLHYKLLEQLDSLTEQEGSAILTKNDSSLVNYIPSTSKDAWFLQVNGGKVMEFKKKTGELLGIFYSNRGGEWLRAGEGKLKYHSSNLLISTIKKINKRTKGEIGYAIIDIKSKSWEKQKGEYRFAL